MIRLAACDDIDRIAEIYEAILTAQDSGSCATGWVRGVYPTADTARVAIDAGELYVMVEEERIVAAARINQVQVKEYFDCDTWQYDAPEHRVLVLHTLTVDPACKGKGYGSGFVRFYEDMARQSNCPYLRMDTNIINLAARALYKKLGYAEIGIVDSVFNGIEGVKLVLLEKYLKE